jgi:hypothetical protein
MSKGNHGQSPNDQRSNSKNPNNPAHKSAQDNRSNQLNPNQQPRHDPDSRTPPPLPKRRERTDSDD